MYQSIQITLNLPIDEVICNLLSHWLLLLSIYGDTLWNIFLSVFWTKIFQNSAKICNCWGNLQLLVSDFFYSLIMNLNNRFRTKHINIFRFLVDILRLPLIQIQTSKSIRARILRLRSKLQNKICNQNDAFCYREFIENLKTALELILGVFLCIPELQNSCKWLLQL
jgi:hypothetical protein